MFIAPFSRRISSRVVLVRGSCSFPCSFVDGIRSVPLLSHEGFQTLPFFDTPWLLLSASSGAELQLGADVPVAQLMKFVLDDCKR